MEALAEAFRRLSVVIAADWSAPSVGDESSHSFQRDTTPELVVETFVRLAECDSIHPVWQAKPMLMGHWGF